MKNRGKLAIATVSLVAVLLLGYRYLAPIEPPSELTTVRITFTPYPDTSLFYFGLKKGFFRDEGLDLSVRDLTWNEQIEFVAGDGTDLAMATLDEVAAKSRNLHAVKKPVDYFLPAWLFEGTIFPCQGDMQTLAELRVKYDELTARKQFLAQLKGKVIAVPESGVYDSAIRRFILGAGEKLEDFQFVNTQLETGVNGLESGDVGMAAAGAFERPEALRRGYKIGLDSVDLNLIVITGFIANGDYYDKNPDVIEAFSRAWYRTLREALANKEECYNVVAARLSETGSKPISLADFKAALNRNKFPQTPEATREMFLDPEAPTYWRKSWDSAIETLKDSGKEDQIPLDASDFKAMEVNKRLQESMTGEG